MFHNKTFYTASLFLFQHCGSEDSAAAWQQRASLQSKPPVHHLATQSSGSRKPGGDTELLCLVDKRQIPWPLWQLNKQWRGIKTCVPVWPHYANRKVKKFVEFEFDKEKFRFILCALWIIEPWETFLGFRVCQHLFLRLFISCHLSWNDSDIWTFRVIWLLTLRSSESVFSWSLSPQHQCLQFYGLASVLVLYLCSSFSVRCQICWLFRWSWWQARLCLVLVQFWGHMQFIIGFLLCFCRAACLVLTAFRYQCCNR